MIDYIRRWLRRGAPEKRIIVQKITLRHGMTLDSWKRSSQHITDTQTLWATPLMQDILSVLRNCVPGGPSYNNPNVSETQAALELGRIQGYMACLQVLQSLPEFTTEPQPDPEADYGADDILKKEY